MLHRGGEEAVLLQSLGRAGGREQAEAQLRKLAGHVRRLGLVLVAHGQKQAALMAHLVPGSYQTLVDGLLQVGAQAQHLAGGLHLRAQVGIHVRQLLKGEAGHLHRVVGALAVQSGTVAHVADLLAQHGPHSQIHHRHARHLADIRHGTAGAGIGLNDVHLVVVDDILDVDQAQGTQLDGDLLGHLDEPLHHGAGQVPGGIDGNGVAAMHACGFHMLHDAGNQHILAIADGVSLGLDALEVLVDQDGVLNALGQDDLHVLDNVAVLVGNDHVLSAQHIGGAHQYGIAQLIGGLKSFLGGHNRGTLGALDAVLLHGRIEALAILRRVNHIRGGTQNAHASLLQGVGQLDSRLAAKGRHNAHRLLRCNDAQHVLGGQGLKVQAIGGVEVGGDGLGVVVDHDHVITGLLKHPHAVDRGIVELDALADADGAGAQHHHAGLLGPLGDELFRFVLIVIGGVEVGRFRRELRRAGIHHLVHGIPVEGHLLAGQPLDGLVGIAHALGLQVGVAVDMAFLQAALHQEQVPELVQEEVVDFGNLMQLFQTHAPADGLVHREHALVGALGNQRQQLLIVQVGHGLHAQGVAADFRAAHSLHQGLLHVHADGHDLARGLHLGAQGTLAVDELVEGPLGHLSHNVVDGRLEAGAGLAGEGVHDLIQRVADGDLRRALGDGIARGLGGQGGGATHAGIDLDDRILEGVGVQGELAVAAAFHLQGGDDVQGGPAEHLILLVGQGQRRSHHDGVAGMHAYGVNVLHGADGNHVALAVPHDLELDFLPAGDALFHQNLGDGAQAQAVLGNLPQLLLILADAAAGAAQGVGGTHDHRIADLFGEGQRVGDVLHHLGGNAGLVDGLHGLLELQAILGLLDGLAAGAQQLHAVLLQEALLGQLHGQGQATLAAQGGQQAVRLFLDNDAPQRLQGQGLNVDMVGGSVISLNGGGIGVDQHHLQPGSLQRAAGLGACVVELRRLTDDDGAGANNQNLVQFRIQRHSLFPPIMAMKRSKRKRVSRGPPQASGWNWTE